MPFISRCFVRNGFRHHHVNAHEFSSLKLLVNVMVFVLTFLRLFQQSRTTLCDINSTHGAGNRGMLKGDCKYRVSRRQVTHEEMC
jgi:hypothetical protein